MYRMRLAGTTILYSKGPEAKGAKELEIRYIIAPDRVVIVLR